MVRTFLFLLLFMTTLVHANLKVSPQELEKSLKEHIDFDPDGDNEVGHIYIGGHKNAIGQATWIYVKNALEEYIEQKPIFVILELDTPGGEVFSAQQISDALKDLDIHHSIPVVAVIDNWAISAGAMLAYSCRYIATVKDGSMGAALPLQTQGGKSEVASEKVNSAIRADFANRAAFFDRNPDIAEAMVDPDLILVERQGEIVRLQKDEEIQSTDEVITTKGKLLTLNAQEMISLGIADLLLEPMPLIPITEEEKEAGKWPGTKELLFQQPFFKDIPGVWVRAYQMDWKTRFFSILSSPIVTSILFLVLIVCFYLEINTPGFGVAGGLGLFALFLILLSSFAVQAIGWLEILLLIGGAGLILLELFVIPGFGIIGILGIVLALAGLFALMLPGLSDFSFDFDTNTVNAAGEYLLKRLAYLGGALILGVIIIALLGRYLAPRIRLFSPLVLKGEQEAKEGYVAGRKAEELPSLGATGHVVSPLRPSGKVEIEGELYDAMSSGEFVEKGTKVRVVEIEGSKMIVEEV